MLAVITPGDEAAALAGFAGLMSIARAAGAEVRVAYVHALPKPRVDRHDRIVADTDTEMARIEATATSTLGTAARVFDDVPVETVVRFGAPRREAVLEAEVVHAADRGGLLGRGRNAEPVPRRGRCVAAWRASPTPACCSWRRRGRRRTTPIATPRTATPGAERPSVGRAL